MVHITSAFVVSFVVIILHKQTDKTMAELEIDINMRIREWDVIQVRDALQLLQFFSRNDVLPILSVYSKDKHYDMQDVPFLIFSLIG